MNPLANETITKPSYYFVRLSKKDLEIAIDTFRIQIPYYFELIRESSILSVGAKQMEKIVAVVLGNIDSHHNVRPVGIFYTEQFKQMDKLDEMLIRLLKKETLDLGLNFKE